MLHSLDLYGSDSCRPGKPCNPLRCRHPPQDDVDFAPFSISWTHPGIYFYPYHSMPPSPIAWTPDHFLRGLSLLLHCSLGHTALKMIFAKCELIIHALPPNTVFNGFQLKWQQAENTLIFMIWPLLTCHTSLTLPSQEHPPLIPFTRLGWSIHTTFS